MCIAVVAIDPKIILLTQSCDCKRLDNGTPWMKEEATKGIQPNLTLEVQKDPTGEPVTCRILSCLYHFSRAVV